MYEVQTWSTRGGKAINASVMRLLKMAQNKCPRRITGGYKETPTAVLERETDILPLDLYIETIALQRAESTSDYLVCKNIKESRDHI
jgi:hypothetical protein